METIKIDEKDIHEDIKSAGVGQIGKQKRISAVLWGLRSGLNEEKLKLYLLEAGYSEKKAKEMIEIAKLLLKGES